MLISSDRRLVVIGKVLLQLICLLTASCVTGIYGSEKLGNFCGTRLSTLDRMTDVDK